MDLTNTVGLIQYINHNYRDENGNKDKGHLYVIPYFDAITMKNENKIILPWCIEGYATAAAGPVTFSFRFYKMDQNHEFIYNLNTKPETSTVLYGMGTDIIHEDEEKFPPLE
jgi:hypothetical protein